MTRTASLSRRTSGACPPTATRTQTTTTGPTAAPPASALGLGRPSGVAAASEQTPRLTSGPPSALTAGRAASTEPSVREQQSAETERLLRRAAEETGPRRTELLERAIVQSTPMARTLASRYDGRGVDTDDLVQVAYVGLVKAVHGYRPDPTTDFRSYAIPTIRGELKRHFRDSAWMVRPPRRIQDLQAAVNAAEGELAARLHRWPTDEELAERIGVPVEQVTDAHRAQGCFRPFSLDAPVSAGSSLSLANLVADEADTYVLVDQVESLRPAVADLSERDQLILRRRFVDHWTQAEIAAEIGVSQMQVSRLLHRILLTLRSALAA